MDLACYSKLVNLEINRGVTQGNLHNYGTAAIIEGGGSAVLRAVSYTHLDVYKRQVWW